MNDPLTFRTKKNVVRAYILCPYLFQAKNRITALNDDLTIRLVDFFMSCQYFVIFISHITIFFTYNPKSFFILDFIAVVFVIISLVVLQFLRFLFCHLHANSFLYFSLFYFILFIYINIFFGGIKA